jgi:katanin p60 ATPase-containing subunit A1
MPVDLSASIYAEFLKARRRGQTQQDLGNLQTAATAFARAAQLMGKYADYTHDTSVRASRLRKAEFYQDLAAKLSGGGAKEKRKTELEASKKPQTEKPAKPDETFSDEILALIQKPDVRWEDIGGLEDTKRLIKSTYGLALAKKPKGLKLDPGQTMLLYGAPGTGKTLLAAATAGSLDATFFNVKVSNLLSKYFGESPRLISALYSIARDYAPAVVFLDEFEALVPARGSGESGAERRIVSTLLAELDGLAGKDDDRFVLTMAATNLPWLLDSAILSRFQRRVYVPLPDSEARREIINIHTTVKGYENQVSISDLVDRTAGYAGREIEQVCEIAAANMISRENPDLLEKVDAGLAEIQSYEIRSAPLVQEDFDLGFDSVKPATSKSVLRNYETWSGN